VIYPPSGFYFAVLAVNSVAKLGVVHTHLKGARLCLQVMALCTLVEKKKKRMEI
jgi:hypothetical protein